MDETLKAYFAGIFDGEGCISVAIGNSGGDMPQLQINVSNQCRELVTELKKYYGGSISTQRTHFGWSIRNKSAETFLTDIEPYSIIKRNSIKIGIMLASTSLGRGHATHLSDKERLIRLTLFEALRQAEDLRRSNDKKILEEANAAKLSST